MKKYSRILFVLSFAAVLCSCGGAEGNVALLKTATASSSFDNNLTAQLLTDGLICEGEPSFLEVVTSEGEVNKVERECSIDSDLMSRNIINGTSGWIEYRFHGYEIDADKAEVLFQQALEGGRGGEKHTISVPVEKVDSTAGLRLNLSFPNEGRWRVKDVRLFRGGEEVRGLLPSEHFTSAWMSEGTAQEWVMVDLGEVKKTGSVKIHWITPAKESKVEVSKDGENWTEKGNLDENGFLSLGGRCRYVKVLMDGGGQRICASEIEVMGTLDKTAPSKDGWVLQRASEVSADGEAISSDNFDANGWIPATVPGTVLSSFIDLGAVPDPDFGDNWSQISESYFASDWWYRHEFSQKKVDGKRYFLAFDGINWKAEVYLNGKRVTDIAGAFIRSKTDVTDILKDGSNALAVRIIYNAHPGAVKTKTAHWTGYNGGVLGSDSPTFLASIGWDWMTTVRGRNCGIWNDVRIEERGDAQLSDPLVCTEVKDGKASVSVSVQLDSKGPAEVEGWIGKIHFNKNVEGSGEVKFTPEDFEQLKDTDLELWWPNGYGDPILHDAGFKVKTAEGVVDSLHFEAGIREITYDENGGSLHLFVNGRRINPMGGNWGFCQQNLRYGQKDYMAAVRYHAQMNFNMIRNWVGQIAHKEFYEACDHYGILVWQDFWLANPGDGPDPLDEAMFLANAEDYVKRIRQHPCVALYCGRNEGFPPESLDKALKNDIVAQLHPGIPYLSSSSDGPVGGHGPYNARPVKDNFEHLDKFHSERGMPVIPEYETLRKMMNPEDLWPQGEMWGKHDFTRVGAQKATTYNSMMNEMFGEINDVETFAYLAQWLNYDGYRSIFEGANSGDRLGMLLWMSHSCWPSLVFTTYDYYLRPTGAFYGCRKACEMLHFQYNPVTGKAELVNNGCGNGNGLWARVSVYDWKGENISDTFTPVDTENDSVKSLDIEKFETTDPYFISLKLSFQNGGDLCDNFYMIPGEDGLKKLRTLKEATLETEMNKEDGIIFFQIRNTDKVPALLIRLTLTDGEDGEEILPNYYSDNYFSIMPGEEKQVQIIWPDDVNLKDPHVKVTQMAKFNAN